MILSVVFAALVAPSRTPILTYHDIIPARSKSSVWFDCTIQEFKDQINWMEKKGAIFVSSNEVVKSMTEGKKMPAKAICITFADNYEGFYKFAWPILKAKRIPVTQFVHTGFVGSKIGRPKMNWAQLIELDQSGLVTIASQTVSHPADLTKMTPQAVLGEFRKSKADLESKLKHPVVQLAYPNGKFNLAVAALAKQAGYKAAFTEECRPAETASNMLEIPRYVHTKFQEAWNSKSGRQ